MHAKTSDSKERKQWLAKYVDGSPLILTTGIPSLPCLRSLSMCPVVHTRGILYIKGKKVKEVSFSPTSTSVFGQLP